MKHFLVIVSALLLAACGKPGQFPSSTFANQNSGSNSNNNGETNPVGPGNATTTINGCGTASASGLDISTYQSLLNWQKLESSGISFVFIKASEGSAIHDSTFKTHWAGAQGTKIFRGAYHFFIPSDDPSAQANLFLSTVGKLGPSDLPAVLDWEAMDKTPTSTNINNAKIWLDLVERATGKIPIIYTGTYYWEFMNNPSGFERYPLFLAQYNVKCPTLPKGWTKWTFWQTGQGIDSGVGGAVDQDLFNGSVSALTSFISGF